MTFLGLRDSGMSILNNNFFTNFFKKPLDSVSARNFLSRISEFSPFKVSSNNGFQTNLTNKNDYERFCNSLNNGEGEITDPFTGDTLSFTNQDEFIEALAKLEESRMNYIKERARANMILASGGTPKEIHSIYKNTAPQNNGVSVLDDPESPEAKEYFVAMQNDVYDAIISSAKTMSLNELKAFASWVPGLQGLIIDAEAKAERSGLATSIAANKQISDFDKSQNLDYEISRNQLAISNSSDFSVLNMQNLFTGFSQKIARNKLDWNPTIEIA